MHKVHTFLRRNFYLVSGAIVVGSIYVSFGQFTEAVVGYVVGLVATTAIDKFI